MSSWDKIIKQFEQNLDWSSAGAIKFLKTNPSRHQVLAYTKKIVDRVARATDVLVKEKNTNATWNEDLWDAFHEELEDALSLGDHSKKFLGISHSYLYQLADLRDNVYEVSRDGEFSQKEFQREVQILKGSRKELGISRAFERAFGPMIRDLKSGLKKFYTQHKRAMIKPNRNSIPTDVVNKAKKMKIRLTKNVNGKRVRRTEAELRKLIANKKK